MARGSNQAQSGANAGLGENQALFNNASGLYNTLAPELTQEATNPTGLTPEERARMTTASEESAGGSQAGATGQGALLAARTKNAGTADAAIEEAARASGRNLSSQSLKTEMADTALREQNRQRGLSGLEGLYNTNLGAGNQALGEVANNVNANTNAANASWDWAKFILDPAMAAGAQFFSGG